MNTRTTDPYHDLLDLLEREEALYRSLLTLLEKEKGAIVESNAARLEETVKQKEDLLEDLSLLEERTNPVIAELAGALECPPGDLTLSRLIELAHEPYSDRLRRVRSGIVPLRKAVQDQNSANSTLIRHSATLIRGSFAFLTNLMKVNTVYHKTGAAEGFNEGGKILRSSV